MNKLKLLSLMFVVLVFTGCTRVVTKTSAFYDADLSLAGSVYVKAKDAKLQNTLEFKYYKTELEEQLMDEGYDIVEDKKYAKYTALLGYDIRESASSLSVECNDAGCSSGQKLIYTYNLTLDILEKNKKIYESKTMSVGSCGMFSSVFNAMIKGMFKDFPGDVGKVRKKTKFIKTDC
ncbi:MAG: hypothetical protein GY793_00385 [Proteobacteria bacterium]|nr:hypothetical protein [Pseudomonadota bacterium]